jgi:predicted unusual protein kinase regulating ubiquinone biosynthesis (AarF/ABC1/UbiB family)
VSTKTSQRGHVAGGTSGLTTVDAVRGPRATTLLKRCRKIDAVLARRATKAGRQTTAARLHHQSIDRPGAFAVQVRLALEELGPTFVKLGQLLSARSDITPRAL